MYSGADIALVKEWLQAGSINLFGRPFAGKDTQGALLRDTFGGALLGGGDILRGSEMPADVAAAVKTGLLLPTKQYIKIVLPYLKQPQFQGKPLILSSVGRWYGEEEGVVAAAADSGHPLKAVVYLRLDESLVIDRWRKSQASEKRNRRGIRHDDTEEVLAIRLKEYREKTLPVIEYYRTAGLLIELDGSLPPEKVHRSIIRALVNRASATP